MAPEVWVAIFAAAGFFLTWSVSLLAAMAYLNSKFSQIGDRFSLVSEALATVKASVETRLPTELYYQRHELLRQEVRELDTRLRLIEAWQAAQSSPGV